MNASRRIDLGQLTEKAKQAGSLVEEPDSPPPPTSPEQGEPAATESAPDGEDPGRAAAPTTATSTRPDRPAGRSATTTPKDPAARGAEAPAAARASQGGGSAVRAATLIPTELYTQVKTEHGGEGTFGQLITWACEDYPDQVVADVLEGAARPRRVSREPRVMRGAASGKAPTKQITPRFQPEEDAVVVSLLDRIMQEASAGEVLIDPSKITRTALHVAALRAWTRNG